MDPRPRLWWTFASTSLALFAFTLDRLVVTTALPAIRADLGAQVADLEWTVNAYTLSFAVLLLTGAALGDRFGRRRMFTIGRPSARRGPAASRSGIRPCPALRARMRADGSDAPARSPGRLCGSRPYLSGGSVGE